MDNLEERLKRLEDFIGNIDQVSLYANSLQQILDRYIQPLYVEQGTGKTMIINDYLGDLENIPHNIIFKIRASHNVVVNEGEQATIRFQRGESFKDYDLRKMVNKSLVPLESSNYIDGEVYDVYINSQDIAIITANDTGVRALSELESLKTLVNESIELLTATDAANLEALNTRITSVSDSATAYTDAKYTENKNRLDAHDTFLSGITKSGDNYTFKGNIVAAYIETPSLRTTKTVNMSGTSGFVLPSGTTIADPSANLGLTNRQWVNTAISNAINDYHVGKHITGTADANTALSGKANGTFYYKLSQ